jgi:hypothetical protein
VRYRNRHNPRLIVEVVDERAELRTGEIKEPAVAFRKQGGKLTVRRRAEFLRMFDELPNVPRDHFGR